MDTLNNLEKQEGAVPEKTEVQDGATPDIPVVADGTAEVYSKKELETAITEYAKRRDVKTAVRKFTHGSDAKDSRQEHLGDGGGQQYRDGVFQ